MRPTAAELDHAYQTHAGCKAFGSLVAALCRSKSVDAALGALRRSGRHSAETMKSFDQIIERASVAATSSGNSPALAADPSSVERSFLAFVRQREVVGRLVGARRIPARTAIIAQATGAAATWRGPGAAIKLSRGTYTRSVMDPLNVAALTVISDEIAKSDDDAALQLITRDLANTVRTATDVAFLDWENPGIAGEMPAGIAYGAEVLQHDGSLQDDINQLLEIVGGNDWTNITLITSPRLALYLAQAFNIEGLGVNGGLLWGLPVITSAASPTDIVTAGTMESITAINVDDLLITEGNAVVIDTTQAASLEMDSDPSMDSVAPTESNTVALFQANARAVRVNRWINWRMRVPTVGVAVLENIDPLA